MLTGKDAISLSMYEDFDAQIKLALIAKYHNVSLDQVKRLKRFYNYHQDVKRYCSTSIAEKFYEIGLITLVLAPLFKKNQFQAISTIISQVSINITRTELQEVLKDYLALPVAKDIKTPQEASEDDLKVTMHWLYEQGYIVCPRFVLPNKAIAEVIAYKEQHFIIVATSVEQNLEPLLAYCDALYILTATMKPLNSMYGQIMPFKHSIEILKADEAIHATKSVTQLVQQINRTLSQRNIF